jgi:hypothetical protein
VSGNEDNYNNCGDYYPKNHFEQMSTPPFPPLAAVASSVVLVGITPAQAAQLVYGCPELLTGNSLDSWSIHNFSKAVFFSFPRIFVWGRDAALNDVV